ncbi:MAG: tRNA (N6-isopentenyl adenosine(37)-C2)-methylthiotransferase MiaB [Planctomycetes bacterium]|nr:tRNA (N6-isopentenyl adenosine(37)-C2)-methylthiotransferase MiaB [Planctomycetota bacterium]
MADKPKQLYIETVGCQMNLLDSELVVAALRKQGYELTDSIGRADVVLFNTCSVRQHAEDKIYSALGRIKHRKRKNPDLVIGVLGCMAQKDQELIFRRAPHVDLVAGPGQLRRVPELIEQVQCDRQRQTAVSLPRTGGTRHEVTESFDEYDPDRLSEMRPDRFQAFVRVMMGCDKFCTFCIVPSVRGPEQSRPPEALLAEARQLADQGCIDITLLGQTVNSYKFPRGDGRTTRLPELLEQIHDIAGIERIKFITNFPRDMSDDLLQAMRELPKVSRYLHVPAQHGSDEVLRRMKRGYTIELYEEMLSRAREQVPGVAVSSDFIVGFCGETDREHELTCDLVRRARFKNSFVFKYSPRPGTKAYDNLPDDVPEDVKRARNNELLAIQNQVSLEDNRQFIGQTVELLVEGPSKAAAAHSHATAGSGPRQLTGRTREDRIVVFQGNERLAGIFAQVRIEAVTPTTLIGSIVTHEEKIPRRIEPTLGTTEWPHGVVRTSSS